MLREGLNHGFTEKDWANAKAEARQIMIESAKVRSMVSYSDLVNAIRSIELAPNDPRLFHMLGEIASSEDTAGRGLLTAVVVHKSGDMQPGKGFFELAKSLGRGVMDQDNCWMEELAKVYDYWANH